jgi:multimeric flavodoxin WrbA
VVGLAVVGSPRAGNTALAVDELLAGVRGDPGVQGDDVVALQDCRMVEPIGDCRACIDAGACTRDDDFAAVMERVYAAELLVLATPLYWYGPSAQLKGFLDRWSCLLDREEERFRARMRCKRTALVVAQGERGFYEAGPCLQMLEWVLRYLDMRLAARVVVVGHARGDLAADAVQRSAVRDVGRELARHPVAGDLMPPWFHLAHRPGTPLGGVFDPAPPTPAA